MYPFFFKVQFEDEIVSSRKVLLSVLDPNKVEHNTKYVITKQGGNITLDCTDFNGAVNWRRLGGQFRKVFPTLFIPNHTHFRLPT